MNALNIAILCALVIGAFTAPQKPLRDDPIPILTSRLDGPNPDGSYNYSYETGNGIHAQEEGQLVKIADDEDAIRVRGSFGYNDVDGRPVNLGYTADENGFQPSGEHLPTAPPIPAAILKALEYIALHPEEDNL